MTPNGRAVSRAPLKIIYYRRGASKRWSIGLWRMSSGTALDIGPFRVMTRRAFRGATSPSDWWGGSS